MSPCSKSHLSTSQVLLEVTPVKPRTSVERSANSWYSGFWYSTDISWKPKQPEASGSFHKQPLATSRDLQQAAILELASVSDWDWVEKGLFVKPQSSGSRKLFYTSEVLSLAVRIPQSRCAELRIRCCTRPCDRHDTEGRQTPQALGPAGLRHALEQNVACPQPQQKARRRRGPTESAFHTCFTDL